MQISAVVPAYNYGHCIGRALRSILAQTRPVAEIVVVDDGSTDDTAAAVAAVARANSGAPIRYLSQQNAGPSAARNHGVRAAASPWVAFLDADDYWYPQKLARQAALARHYPGAGLLFSGVDLESLDGVRKPAPLPRTGIYPWRELLRENWVFSPTPVVHKELVEKAGGFDEGRRHAEDWDLWLRVAELAPAAGVREPLACYLDHGAGLHASRKMIEGSWAVLGAALGRGAARLRRGESDRTLAALLAAEAVAAAGSGGRDDFLQKGRAALRLDLRQAPRLAWAALFSAARGRLYA